MKKLLPILLVLMMLCSTAFATGFEVPAEGYDGSEVTITFCTQQGTALQEVTTNYIAEFNKLYPNIHVEHTTQGSYDDVRDQIVTDISVGAQPNVAYCYPDHVALYNLAKAVQTLDELIDSEVFAPLLKGLDNMGERYRILFLSDHYTPICTRTHDGTPVPYLLYDSGVKTQRGLPYCEESAAAVGNRLEEGTALMPLRAVSKSKRARGRTAFRALL